MNSFYAQSGGVTAVINASAYGVIQATRENSATFGNLYAGRNGILGALREELIDTSCITNSELELLCHTPGGAFGSCRYKLKPDSPDYERLLKVFIKHDIGYFFYNGGGDSQDTALKVANLAAAKSYPLKCIGIPKTIDNDLPYTDTCPGYASTAKYIATSMLEASFDVRSMAATSTKVFILECMGRNTGWIAASTSVVDAINATNIILLPEIAFDEAKFVDKVQTIVNEHGFCTVSVAEGVRDKAGNILSKQNATDSFGHPQLGGVAPYLAGILQHQLDYKCHFAIADYLQRSAAHILASIDLQQAIALGKRAVELAAAGEDKIMVTIERTSDSPYKWQIGKVPLEKVANIERGLPSDFISKDGFGVTSKCKDYIRSLISGEVNLKFRHGLPVYVTLQHKLAAQKLEPYALCD